MSPEVGSKRVVLIATGSAASSGPPVDPIANMLYEDDDRMLFEDGDVMEYE